MSTEEETPNTQSSTSETITAEQSTSETITAEQSTSETITAEQSTSETITAEQSNSETTADDGALKDDEDEASASALATSLNEHIRLRVITSDMSNEVIFRVRPATALGRMKRSYCTNLGYQVEELRFLFDGHRIADNDTPQSLYMVDGDVIEIYQERTGGM